MTTPSAPLRALVLEDEPLDAELVVAELRRHGIVLSWDRVETEERYLASLEPPPDVILADYRLPRFGAMRALELLRSLGLDVPFLVVTGDAREEIAVECMKAGASDFLVKDRLARLAAAVENALEAKRLRDEKARADREREERRESLEDLVRERTSQLHRSERRAKLARDVASAANAARTPGEAILAAIRCAAEHWGWPLGHAFVVDASTGRHVDSGCWYMGERERFVPFLEASAPSRFVEADGFLRKVFALDAPCWIPLPSPPSVFSRGESATRAGLGFVCALPVRARERLFAVLELFGEGTSGPDAGDLELLTQVGRQLGITCDRLESEAELKKLSLAVAQSPATVVITDRTGRIEYVNPAFETSTGYAAVEGLGQTPRILKSGVHPPSFYAELWSTILRGETWHGELCNRRKNGEVYWESASISPIRSEGGEVTGFVGVKLDISDRKEAETQLERAKEGAEQANRAKSVFLASMSHEIRTPLNAVLGFSQLLMDDRDLTAVQREHLASINASGEHLLALINDILEMSKIEAGRTTLNPVSSDLHALLTDIERMFQFRADQKQLELSFERTPDLPRLLVVDETKLRQILVNLIGNAVKFTRQGGVRVRVRHVPGAGSSFRLVVEVEDTGPGISGEDLPRLFQQFEQARRGTQDSGGTGLGLAISRAFARLMGGDVTVQSRPGEGSVFTVEVTASAFEEAGKPFREADLLRKVRDAAGLPHAAGQGDERGTKGTGAAGADGSALAHLPEPIRSRLWTAVVRADLDEIRSLGEELARSEPATASQLLERAERFEYDQLLAQLGKGGGDA